MRPPSLRGLARAPALLHRVAIGHACRTDLDAVTRAAQAVLSTVASAPNRACRATCSLPMHKTATATAPVQVQVAQAGEIAVSGQTGASNAAGVAIAQVQAGATSARSVGSAAERVKGFLR